MYTRFFSLLLSGSTCFKVTLALILIKKNVLVSSVQKPEKLSSVFAAGALRDGVCAYTALHTHARMAAGHTLLVMDGASVSTCSQIEH